MISLVDQLENIGGVFTAVNLIGIVLMFALLPALYALERNGLLSSRNSTREASSHRLLKFEPQEQHLLKHLVTSLLATGALSKQTPEQRTSLLAHLNLQQVDTARSQSQLRESLAAYSA